MFSPEITERAGELLELCRSRSLKLATVESCTGGLIAGCLTAHAGSSDVLERGYVTYSNDAKAADAGVPAGLIESHGAVSETVAAAMAEGALARTPVDVAVSVTGIAGPGGATPTKPVGLVYIAAAVKGGETTVERYVFPGDRTAVRNAAVFEALDLTVRSIQGS